MNREDVQTRFELRLGPPANAAERAALASAITAAAREALPRMRRGLGGDVVTAAWAAGAAMRRTLRRPLRLAARPRLMRRAPRIRRSRPASSPSAARAPAQDGDGSDPPAPAPGRHPAYLCAPSHDVERHPSLGPAVLAGHPRPAAHDLTRVPYLGAVRLVVLAGPLRNESPGVESPGLASRRDGRLERGGVHGHYSTPAV